MKPMAVVLRGAMCVGALGLAGCAPQLPTEMMRAPTLSPIGAGLTPAEGLQPPETEAPLPLQWGHPNTRSENLYTDQRISHIGDIVTVVIAINDKATFGTSSDRSTTSKTGFSMDFLFTPPTAGAAGGGGSPGKLTTDTNSTSSAGGQGNIDRSEQIQVSVPAVVTRVLPNGNLMVRGSQEVRVNFEMRQVSVAGIVHPADISRNNTINYDRVAEARISYGGRGRLTEVQQPAWGQQIYDYVKPF